MRVFDGDRAHELGEFLCGSLLFLDDFEDKEPKHDRRKIEGEVSTTPYSEPIGYSR